MTPDIRLDAAHLSRRLVDHAPSMLAYWDTDMYCRFANRAYGLWYGGDSDKLVGRHISELLGPQLFELNEPHMRAALRGEAQRFERVAPGPDGEQRHFLASYTPDLVDGRVMGFMAQVTDVTPLKQTQVRLEDAVARLEAEVHHRQTVEQSLQDSQQSLAVTLTAIGAGFLATDREGRVTRINDFAQRALGWSAEQARGRALWDVFMREDRPASMLEINAVDVMLERHITAEEMHEFTVIAADGRRVPMQVYAGLTHDPGGQVRGMVVIFRDVTRLKAAETEREHAEGRFRRVFEASSSALLMLDRERRIVLANHKAETLFGFAPGELLGQNIDPLVPVPARAAHGARVDQYFERPASRAMGLGRDLRACRKDGTEFPVEISLDPIPMNDGLYTLASVNDISQRKRQDDELRRSNAELEQFAYVASHDLQEPLRMVVSYSELLAQRYQGKLDEKADKYIHYAVDGARRMQRLVADLMAYSRVGSQGKPLVPVDTGAVLQRVLKVLDSAIVAAGATIEAQPLPKVLGDELQLEQLMQNLIGNAIKFRAETPLRVSVGARRLNDRWEFFVSDNGIGIEPQYVERIFQMFQRLHERGKYEGSGIGLAIVKRIVERHGGAIRVASAFGAGTSFLFTLTAVPDRAATAASPAASAP